MTKTKKPEIGVEAEKLILDLAKQGLTSDKIGLALKEKGIGEHEKISEILRKNNIFEDADIKNLTIKVERLKKHIAKNIHDYNTHRALFILEAKLNKLKKYRSKKG